VVPKKWIKSKNLERSAQVSANISKQPRSLECYQACLWPMDNKRWNLQELFGYVLRRGNKSLFKSWLHDPGETIEPTWSSKEHNLRVVPKVDPIAKMCTFF
jgi:hypothetical protein